MARGSPWQARLERDLVRGTPIAYRQVPGNKLQYYNPAAPSSKPVSQHYVLRIYHKALQARDVTTGSQDRAMIRDLSNVQRAKQREIRKSILITHRAAGGNMADRDRINTLIRDLKYWQYRTRRLPIGSPNRNAALSPDGSYAKILVALGRRLPTDTWDVGSSPIAKNGYITVVGGPYAGTYSDQGGYINTIVLPVLRGEL